MRKIIKNNLALTSIITIIIGFLAFYTDIFTNTYIDQILRISSQGSNVLSNALDIFNLG